MAKEINEKVNDYKVYVSSNYLIVCSHIQWGTWQRPVVLSNASITYTFQNNWKAVVVDTQTYI